MAVRSISQHQSNYQDAPIRGVCFIQELNLAALNQKKDKELFLWYVLRALNASVVAVSLESETNTKVRKAKRDA